MGEAEQMRDCSYYLAVQGLVALLYRAMAPLKNIRQERFCQLVIQGMPPYRAYPSAGYAANHGAPYRLKDNVRVKARLGELTKGLAMKTRVTVESITAELDRVAAGAEEAKQYGAAKGAIETKAKLHGLLVDRKETGQPGDFATLTTPDAVLEAIRKEFGPDAAALLQASVSTGNGESEDEPNLPEAGPGEGDAIN